MRIRLFLSCVLFFFTITGALSPQLVKFNYNDRVGFLDENLNVVVKPVLLNAYYCKNPAYIVTKSGANSFQIRSRTGEVLHNINTSFVIDINGDLFAYYKDSGMELFDVKTMSVVTNACISYGRTDEYLVPVIDNGKVPRATYYSIKDSKIVNRDRYRKTYGYYEGYSVVQLANWKYSILDREGNRISDIEYSSLGQRFSGGLLQAELVNGETGYIDYSGNMVIKTKIISDEYLEATGFTKSRALVKTDDSPNIWRIVDRNGKYIGDRIFIDTAEEFSNGISLVSTYNSKHDVIAWGYLKDDGSFLIPSILSYAEPFVNDYAQIKYKGRDALVNREGQLYWIDDLLNGTKKKYDVRDIID